VECPRDILRKICGYSSGIDEANAPGGLDVVMSRDYQFSKQKAGASMPLLFW